MSPANAPMAAALVWLGPPPDDVAAVGDAAIWLDCAGAAAAAGAAGAAVASAVCVPVLAGEETPELYAGETVPVDPVDDEASPESDVDPADDDASLLARPLESVEDESDDDDDEADACTCNDDVSGWLNTTRSVGLVGRMATARLPLLTNCAALNL